MNGKMLLITAKMSLFLTRKSINLDLLYLMRTILVAGYMHLLYWKKKSRWYLLLMMNQHLTQTMEKENYG